VREKNQEGRTYSGGQQLREAVGSDQEGKKAFEEGRKEREFGGKSSPPSAGSLHVAKTKEAGKKMKSPQKGVNTKTIKGKGGHSNRAEIPTAPPGSLTHKGRPHS